MAAADRHREQAERLLSRYDALAGRRDSVYTQPFTPEDRDRRLAEVNRDIDELLALAQVHATLSIGDAVTSPPVEDELALREYDVHASPEKVVARITARSLSEAMDTAQAMDHHYPDAFIKRVYRPNSESDPTRDAARETVAFPGSERLYEVIVTTTEHDAGTYTIEQWATDPVDAIRRVMASEMCPAQAITSVNFIRSVGEAVGPPSRGA